MVIADSDLVGFHDSAARGADLLMGNRFEGGIAPGAMPSVTFSLSRIGEN